MALINSLLALIIYKNQYCLHVNKPSYRKVSSGYTFNVLSEKVTFY